MKRTCDLLRDVADFEFERIVDEKKYLHKEISLRVNHTVLLSPMVTLKVEVALTKVALQKRKTSTFSTNANMTKTLFFNPVFTSIQP
jgi:hypothetical protein